VLFVCVPCCAVCFPIGGADHLSHQHLYMAPPLHNLVHLVPVIHHPSTSIYSAILCLFGGE